MEEDDSPLFNYLRDQLPDLLERAQVEGWKVAVPKAAALRGVALSQALVESHLLRQTSIRDELVTANGKIVSVIKNPKSGSVRLASGKGFPEEGIEVDVLSEDLWYGPNSEQGLQLVRISSTLEGDASRMTLGYGLDSLPSTLAIKKNKDALPDSIMRKSTSGSDISYKDFAGNEVALWCHQNSKCREFLQGLPKSKDALLKLEGSISQFQKCYIMARGYESETAEKLKGFATEFADNIESGSYDAAYKAAICHVLNTLHPKIWKSLKDIYCAGDRIALASAEKKKRENFEGLGVPKEFVGVDFGGAVNALSTIDDFHSPVLKLECLRDVHEKISSIVKHGAKTKSAVTVFGSKTFTSSGSALGMDEFLPLFLYVFCQARIPYLLTTFKYITHFSAQITTSELDDFLLRLYESAIEVFTW